MSVVAQSKVLFLLKKGPFAEVLLSSGVFFNIECLWALLSIFFLKPLKWFGLNV